MNAFGHFNKKQTLTVLVFFLYVLCGQVNSQVNANKYFDLLTEGINSSRIRLSDMTSAAELAAEKFIAGGRIFSCGSSDFMAEAIGRAGGLMSLKNLTTQKVTRNDVILFGVRGNLTKKDCARIKTWRKAGAFVVTFGAGIDKTSKLPVAQVDFTSVKTPGLKINWNRTTKLCPVDTVMNVVNLWAFTGELVAACTRRGKMPVLYQSYGVPGGRKRGAKYSGKKFHDDMTIKPVKPGVLGKAYLDTIENYIKKVRIMQLAGIVRSGQKIQNSNQPDGLLLFTIGHMFPAHFTDPRAPQGFDAKAVPHGSSPKLMDKPGRFVLFVGYQGAPQNLIDSAGPGDFVLSYMSVQKGKLPEGSDRLIYINPYWPINDNCVSVPGYDIPILPASGVIDAAIYWAIRAESQDKPKAEEPKI